LCFEFFLLFGGQRLQLFTAIGTSFVFLFLFGRDRLGWSLTRPTPATFESTPPAGMTLLLLDELSFFFCTHQNEVI
jgi:hypothetical protein